MTPHRSTPPRIVLLLLTVATLALAGCSGSSSAAKRTGSPPSNAGGSGGFEGAGLTPPQRRPAFTLTDTSGRKFSFATITGGHPTLLYFGYTNCPDVCPTTMADISQALTRVPAAVAEQTYVVFVSTDVKRDTGPVIARWLSNFSVGTPGTWVGLRGTQTQIDSAQRAAHISLAEDGGATHSAQTLLYGPDDYAHVTFLQNDSLRDQIVHDLPLVAAGAS